MFAVAKQFFVEDVVFSMGMHLGTPSVYEDMNIVNTYGNASSRASWHMESGPMEASANIFVATLRLEYHTVLKVSPPALRSRLRGGVYRGRERVLVSSERKYKRCVGRSVGGVNNSSWDF